MNDLLDFILLMICIAIMLVSTLSDLLSWRRSVKEKDSENLIIIRNYRKIYFRIAYKGFLLIISIIFLTDYVISGTIPYLCLYIIISDTFTFSDWQFRFTDQGIMPVFGYVRNLLPWDSVKRIRWQTENSDVLVVEHQRGHTKIKVSEKKNLVAGFIEKYRPIG